MKINLKGLAKTVSSAASEHAPGILTGLGITGMVVSIVLAVRATPKAEEKIEEAKAETPIEIVKATWKCYVPTAVMATTSAVCIFSGNHINGRRNAALAAAYTLSDQAFREYKSKVVETLGEKKEKQVRDDIAQDKVNTEQVRNAPVIMTGKGTTLCYESITGRKFYSDIETIRQKVNDVNEWIVRGDFVSVNDWLETLGLPFYSPEYTGTTSGARTNDQIGWQLNPTLSGGQLEIDFSSILIDGTPAVYIGYKTLPKYYR